MRIIIHVIKTDTTIYYDLTINRDSKYQYRCEAVQENYSLPYQKKLKKTHSELKKLSYQTLEIRKDTEIEETFIDTHLTLEKNCANIFLKMLETKLNSRYHFNTLAPDQLQALLKTIKAKCYYQHAAATTFFNKLGFYKDLTERLSGELNEADKIKLTRVSKDGAQAAHKATETLSPVIKR